MSRRAGSRSWVFRQQGNPNGRLPESLYGGGCRPERRGYSRAMGEFHLMIGTPWPWWLILAAAGGAGVVTWRGYRRRASEVAGRTRGWLSVLRWSAWLLLALCLLQPVRRQILREAHASRITVLVDDSESMSFADRAQGPSRLSRVLEYLGDEAGKSGLLGELGRSFRVQLEGFAAQARPLNAPAELKADGARTDLAQALNDAYARLRGPDATGLVLISDGADTRRSEFARAAAAYQRAGLPIYVVGVGAADVPDLAVTQVRCRRQVSRETLARVEVDVARSGFPPGKHSVRLLHKGQVVKTADADLQDGSATARFEFLPAEQGFLEYEVAIEPAPGELITANNRLAFGFVAFSRKLRILYMEGSIHQHNYYGRYTWGDKWEHQFLQEALEEDKDVEVTVLLGDPGERGEARPPAGMRFVKDGYPKTKKELYRYDVIVNSDISYDQFTEDQVKWTVDFVARHGGGFCMIGGWHAFGEGGYAKTAFDRMLPVEMNAADTHEHGKDFRWRITDDGWLHPILQIDRDAGKNREIWAQLNTLGPNRGPAFHGYSKTTHAKPAATVLAVVDEEDDPGSYLGPMVLVAVQPFGRGRSMAFTTDSTGGWGAEWEDAWGDDPYDPSRRNIYYKTFWKNAVRWLAHYRMQAPNQLVVIDSDRLVYGRGESADLRVKVLTEDYDPTHDARVTVTVTEPGGEAKPYSLFPRYDEPGIYERKLDLNAVGTYRIEAVAVLKNDELGRDATILQVRPSSEELRRLNQDVGALQRIAAESGGVYLPIEEAGKLPELLHQDMHLVRRYRHTELWDRWWVFALLVGVLCAEWFFRKKNGLP